MGDETLRLSDQHWPALAELNSQLGLAPYFGGDVSLQGTDPILKSPHHLGEAIGTVLALNGLAASAIWQHRTGEINNINLSIYDAIHHLHPTHFLWQSRYQMNLNAENVPTNGLFKCKDGRYIMILSGPPYPKLQTGYLNFFNCGNNKPALEQSISQWESHELENALNKAGLPACIAYTHDEWLRHPQGEILSNTPFIEIEKIADGEPVAFSSSAISPLHDIKVLDFTHVLAGPRSSRTLAEYGANVLHISSPYHADTQIQNLLVNQGKRSAYLDLNEQKARNRMYELISTADVLSYSYRPSVAEKFNITPRDAIKLNKKGIVYLSINAYGHTGPWNARPGFDHHGQAASGFCVEEGSLSDPKFTPVFYLNDLIAGYAASAGIMSALLRRATEGGSYHVKVSLTRSAMWVQGLGYMDHELLETVPEKDIYPAKFTTADTVYGEVTYLASALKFSSLPKVVLPPAVPYGAHNPEW